MCGIIAYTGSRPAIDILLDGLSRLEYRGYDSAGVAVGMDGKIYEKKAHGKVRDLVGRVNGHSPAATYGIGHTRWATHGAPSDVNAHPHSDCSHRIMVAHNGIVENFRELREELRDRGHRFLSETDSEVIPHLIESLMAQGVTVQEAVRCAALCLAGHNVFVAMCADLPGTLVAVRRGTAGGVVIGHGAGEMWLASDIPALAPYTRSVSDLSHGEMAVLTASGVGYFDEAGREVLKQPRQLLYDAGAVTKGQYAYFMEKEIREQPRTLFETFQTRIDIEAPSVRLEGISLTAAETRALGRIVLIGMGSSFHAAYAGRSMIEQVAGLPAEVENSAEFRYRNAPVDGRTLVVAVGQSGETADTLAAMAEARDKGARVIAVCNVEGSQATRLAEGTVMLRAGPEISVCATKSFTSSLIALYLLALRLGADRGNLGPAALRRSLTELVRLPDLVGPLLRETEAYQSAARRLARVESMLFLGRGTHYPIALEGALKMKEISYIHAEGLHAGEMKHGHIALIDSAMPVVALVPRDGLTDKMVNAAAEVKARDGVVIAVSPLPIDALGGKADVLLPVPEAPAPLQSVLSAVALQLLAYYTARERGCDIDQPRNLAKSVTVE